ncbi:hypothetical protein WN51_08029 [Melipona quadrifasciata]|uniref:Uncharacterized protein n=1 Tax=Melipona quadrifasciata TaxID=166423 RepID=A0A0N0U2U6_9HYME|nr:hypothetical protein WN51_08029 [Melipona quadrifasciata]
MHASRSAYDLIWYKQTLNMQKNLLNVLTYQKPVTFSISFIIPDLSLRYYCSVRRIIIETSIERNCSNNRQLYFFLFGFKLK